MSKIEWTDKSWNPVSGCTPCSPGCKNCWAKKFAPRLAGRFGYPEQPRQFDVTLHPDKLGEPLKWRKPRKIFVCSMGDLFHKDVPTEFIYDVLRITTRTLHTYQILTKRPERMKKIISDIADEMWPTSVKELFPRVWLGVSAENQQTADERIPILLSIPAKVRFVSVEPMLQEIDLKTWLGVYCKQWVKLDWVVCGAESGPSRRPFDIEWARDLKNQCVESDTPFFFKQSHRNGKVIKMPEIDGRVWNEMPNLNFSSTAKVQTSF